MTRIRRHKRQTASGKVVNVRAHERDTGDGQREVPEWSQPTPAGRFVPQGPVGEESLIIEDFWADEEPFPAETGVDAIRAAGLSAWANFRADAAALRQKDAERPVVDCPVCSRPMTGPGRSCACAPTDHNVAAWGRALKEAGY